jgi:hypothetical protein
VDSQTEEEWKTLLEWLIHSFPDTAPAEYTGKSRQSSDEPQRFPGKGASNEEQEEEEMTEGRLIHLRWQHKAGRDPAYVRQLLDNLKRTQFMAEQIEALEQLSHIHNEEIVGELAAWLGGTVVHPLVLFRGLQTLKAQGMIGELTAPKQDGSVKVRIEDTPTGNDDYPGQIADIWNMLVDESVHDGAEIAEFAKVMLQEFIAFIYTTPVYRHLLELDPSDIRAWAAALHSAVVELLPSPSPTGKPSVPERYGIADGLERIYEQALQYIRRFASQVYRQPPLS